MKNLIPVMILLVGTSVSPAGADPILSPSGDITEAHQLIHDAGHALDEAWDAFHKAALGGTLASPEIQTSIETDLMHGRALLRKAMKAQHEGDIEMERTLTEQIQQISKRIVIQSQMEKE